MILDAVQGVLQPYILVLNDYSALVVFSQKRAVRSEVDVEQLVKSYTIVLPCTNPFTGYAYQEMLKNYEEAQKCVQNFPLMRTP